MSSYSTARRRRLRAKGMCQQCARWPAVPGQRLCVECREDTRAGAPSTKQGLGDFINALRECLGLGTLHHKGKLSR